MKRLIFVMMAMGLMLSTSFAQPNQRKQDIEAARIAFITKEVGLTPEEAQKFWPVYNAYQDEIRAVKKESKQNRNAMKQGFDTKSDKEIEALLDQELALRKKEVNIQEKYHHQLKGVIGAKKLAKLYAAEERFKKVMLKKLREQNRQPGNRPNGGGNRPR